MKTQNRGWVLIVVALVIGTLRILDLIDTNVTAGLMMLAIIMYSGAVMGARKKRAKEEADKVSSVS